MLPLRNDRTIEIPRRDGTKFVATLPAWADHRTTIKVQEDPVQAWRRLVIIAHPEHPDKGGQCLWITACFLWITLWITWGKQGPGVVYRQQGCCPWTTEVLSTDNRMAP